MIQGPRFTFHDRSGQAIAEAIVALAILTIGYMAVLTLLNRSLSITQVVSDQNIATYLAAEGIEIVKNLSDANIRKGFSYDEDFNVGSYEVSYLTELESDNPEDGDNPGLRVGNQNDFSSTPLRFSPALGYSYDLSGTPTKFFRTVRILPPAPPARRMQIVSIVQWNQKGGGRGSVQLEDFFFTNN
ncbi:MAG: hypothetical protein G01um101420_732 [Parcubacteria group bacterium Gr01-1014_20]|nr:MAG: hypothetical protein G01um101420_732 [Parcubacteria group bacterium Gr01-1014_20]